MTVSAPSVPTLPASLPTSLWTATAAPARAIAWKRLLDAWEARQG